jgi:hypothetical protein
LAMHHNQTAFCTLVALFEHQRATSLAHAGVQGEAGASNTSGELAFRSLANYAVERSECEMLSAHLISASWQRLGHAMADRSLQVSLSDQDDAAQEQLRRLRDLVLDSVLERSRALVRTAAAATTTPATTSDALGFIDAMRSHSLAGKLPCRLPQWCHHRYATACAIARQVVRLATRRRAADATRPIPMGERHLPTDWSGRSFRRGVVLPAKAIWRADVDTRRQHACDARDGAATPSAHLK